MIARDFTRRRSVEFDLHSARAEEVTGFRVVVAAPCANQVAALAVLAEDFHVHLFQNRGSTLLEGHGARGVNAENLSSLVGAREGVTGKLLVDFLRDAGQRARDLFLTTAPMPIGTCHHKNGGHQRPGHNSGYQFSAAQDLSNVRHVVVFPEALATGSQFPVAGPQWPASACPNNQRGFLSLLPSAFCLLLSASVLELHAARKSLITSCSVRSP